MMTPEQTVGRGLSIGLRNEDVLAWFDVYTGLRPPTPTIMVHGWFRDVIRENGGTYSVVLRSSQRLQVVGVWAYDDGQIRLTASGTEYIYRRTGWVTAGGFTEYGWPD